MKKCTETHEGKDRAAKANIESNRKKKYRRPRLKVYGNLNRLTMGSKGAGHDGGGPKWSKV